MKYSEWSNRLKAAGRYDLWMHGNEDGLDEHTCCNCLSFALCIIRNVKMASLESRVLFFLLRLFYLQFILRDDHLSYVTLLTPRSCELFAPQTAITTITMLRTL